MRLVFLTDRLIRWLRLINQDVVSKVFSTLRLQSDFYFRAHFRGQFSVEVPRERRTVRFHLVREGECYLQIVGSTPLLIRKGDLVLIPDGASQTLSSNTDLPAVSLPQILSENTLENGVFSHGKGREQVSLLCGYCSFDEAIDHPLLTALPALIVLNQVSLKDDPLLFSALKLLSLEEERELLGMSSILSRMLEIILIQVVRRATFGEAEYQTGFFAALRDPKLSKALSVIHNEPQVSWTIDSLAQQAGMSRARFASRFTDFIGAPPISYLTKWRLMKSRELLGTTKLDMEEIANRCGYSCASSFSRRFKEEYKIGPGAFRKSA